MILFEQTDYISDGMRNGTVGAHCNLGCTFSLSVQGEEASYKRFSVVRCFGFVYTVDGLRRGVHRPEIRDLLCAGLG